MIGLLQRVDGAAVEVEGREIARIGKGLLVLVGVERGDDEATADRLLERLASYRVFVDGEGRMNLSVADAGGALLLVPQFTLAADTSRGLRPGFSQAAEPAQAARACALPSRITPSKFAESAPVLCTVKEQRSAEAG